MDLIPDNYKVVQDPNNRLFGVYRLDKSGKLLPLIPCMNKIAAVARAYNRIYILYMPMSSDNGSMILRNYNGNLQLDENLLNIKFGKECIYARTIEPRSKQICWALLDKDLNVVKYLKDFIFTCVKDDLDFYLPSGRERLEVQDATGQIYHLTARTGELEEYHKYERKLNVAPIPVKADKYNIVIDSYKNTIKAIQFPGGAELNVNTITSVKMYIEAFSKLLGEEHSERKEKIEVGRHSEENTVYMFKNIIASKAELFFKLIRQFKAYDSLTNLVILARYLQLNGVSNDKLIEATLLELKSNTYKINTDKTTYGLKLYSIGNDVFGFIQKPDSRISSFQYRMTPNGLIEDGGIISITTTCGKSGITASKLEILECNVTPKLSKTYVKSAKSSGHLSYNTLNNPSLKGRIDRYAYTNEYSVELAVRPESGGIVGEAFNLELIIGDELQYEPRHRSNDKNIVYSGKINDIFIYLA